MFSHPFFISTPVFEAHVRSAHEGRLGRLLRHAAFSLFAHDLLGWFHEHPALHSVKLTAVAAPELEDAGRAVRIRHHFTLSGIGQELRTDDSYFAQRLPWTMTGTGSFSLERTDPVVQQFMKLSLRHTSNEAALAYDALVYGLALRIDAAFSDVSVEHDLGLASSSR